MRLCLLQSVSPTGSPAPPLMGLMGVEVLLGLRESIVETLNEFFYFVSKLSQFGILCSGKLRRSGSHICSRITDHHS